MKRITKKDLALSLHAAGRSVVEIARALETHPSYIANVLAAAGKSTGYSDLYVSTTGKNGAEGIGKYAEAQLFAEWLATHLSVTRHDISTSDVHASEDEGLFAGDYAMAV